MSSFNAGSRETPLQSPVSGVERDIRSPKPDLQSLQGAYVGNIERLEDEAERMSTSGSELGEEIRKLQLEQKLSDSRRSSLLSGIERRTRSRGASASSHAHSIIDVNTTARWGGYSPGVPGHIASPLGSATSGSWSGSRQRSTSGASRLAQISQAGEEDGPLSPRYSALRIASPTEYSESPDMQQDEFTAPPLLKQLSIHDPDDGRYEQVRQESPTRPTSAGSGDTFQQATTLFRDFDGTHYDNDGDRSREGDSLVEGGSSQRSTATRSTTRNSSYLRSLDPPPSNAVPPPDNGMVYYPAPVPQMLNLPKRLSQLPAASVQAKRRTQMLSQLSPDARKSAAWLSGDSQASGLKDLPSPTQKHAARKSQDFRKSVQALPSQLRASMYFDHQGTAQTVEIKGESAQDTLESILEASANAPVSAFTDHPFAGQVGDEVYGREAVRKSTMQALEGSPKAEKKRRSSFGMLLRGKSDDGLTKLHKRNSSRMSMMIDESEYKERADEIDESENTRPTIRHSQISIEPPQLGEIEGIEEHTPLRQSIDDDDQEGREPEQPLDESEDEDTHEAELPTQGVHYGAPTTLLAELQIRKEQQKTRNRTAATAFPNGMHATLLEMDAVAQIEKKKRQNQRVNLAWEDPSLRANAAVDNDDDDVPLGVLYPGRDALINQKRGADPNRTVGLLERREMEDNEPLSRRRNRMLGIEDRPPPIRQSIPLSAVHSADQVTASLPAPPPKDEEEEDGETLGQRLRRLKDKAALDEALGDPKARPVSELFASEMMSQFGVEEETEKPAEVPATVPPEEETLGQRRRRLQAEALYNNASSDQIGGGAASTLGIPNSVTTRPPLRASHSMADILAAHPSGHKARAVSNEMLLDSLPQGSLLAKSEMTKSRHKQELLGHNNRTSTFTGGMRTVPKDRDWDTPLALLSPGAAQSQSRQGMYPPMGGAGMMSPGMNASSPHFFQNGFQQMGMQPQVGMGQHQQQQHMNPMQAQMQQMQMQMQMQMQLMQQNMQSMGMGMNGMGGMGMHAGGISMQGNMGWQEAPMDPRQKELIDRWRQSVHP